MKGELLEGGIRVPLIARWPARIRAGSISQQTAITMDFLPTLLAAAGVKPDSSRPPDGMSLLNAFDDARLVTDRPLFWRFHAHAQAAARRGQYKYLRMEGAEYLFDVVADPQERGNLKMRQAAVFNELKSAWEKWNAEMLAYTPQGTTYNLKTPPVFPDRY
jgi:arylsulfatase A-like enzyme